MIHTLRHSFATHKKERGKILSRFTKLIEDLISKGKSYDQNSSEYQLWTQKCIEELTASRCNLESKSFIQAKSHKERVEVLQKLMDSLRGTNLIIISIVIVLSSLFWNVITISITYQTALLMKRTSISAGGGLPLGAFFLTLLWGGTTLVFNVFALCYLKKSNTHNRFFTIWIKSWAYLGFLPPVVTACTAINIFCWMFKIH
jgi:hypothetical protein